MGDHPVVTVVLCTYNRDTSSTVRRVQYVFEPRQGVAHARNAGVAAARTDIIAFTDDDVRVSEDWVRVVKRAFDAHPEVDGLARMLVGYMRESRARSLQKNRGWS